MNHWISFIITLFIVMLFAISCGNGTGTSGVSEEELQPSGDDMQTSDGLEPTAQPLPVLPVDQLQPWESGRVASGITAESEMQTGVERFSDDTTVVEEGEALTLTSVDDSLSWAMYRIPLGNELGVVSTDVNLGGDGCDGPGEYWVALGDYGHNQWQWYGPFSDSHVRLSATYLGREGSSYISSLGNLYLIIGTYNGNSVDIVAVSAEAADSGDTTAPDAPNGLVAAAMMGALGLRWNNVIAGDLAGYRLYWSYSPFTAPDENGVQTIANLQGRTEYILTVQQQRMVYAAVSAVDISGNVSELSTPVSELPGAGDAATVFVSVNNTSVMRGEVVQVVAAGADEYAWDLDGTVYMTLRKMLRVCRKWIQVRQALSDLWCAVQDQDRQCAQHWAV